MRITGGPQSPTYRVLAMVFAVIGVVFVMAGLVSIGQGAALNGTVDVLLGAVWFLPAVIVLRSTAGATGAGVASGEPAPGEPAPERPALLPSADEVVARAAAAEKESPGASPGTA